MRRPVAAALVAGLALLGPSAPVARSATTYASLATLAGSPEVTEKAYAVSVVVDGGIATVTTKQTLANRGDQDHELLYRFPLPAEAVVTGLSVTLPGGKVASGLLVDAEAAITLMEDPEGVDAKPDVGLLRQMAVTDTHAVYELRVYPVPAGKSVEVATTYVVPLRLDGGRLGLRLPGRGGAANLATPKLKLTVTAPAGTKGLREVTGAGKVLAANVQSGKGSWSFDGPRDGDTVIEVAPQFVAKKPVVTAARVALGDSQGVLALSLMAPPPTAAEIPHYDRVLFVLDVSRSVAPEGLDGERAIVREVLNALPADVQVEAVLFDRSARRVLGGFKQADKAARASIEAAIEKAPLENGSDLGAALSLARPILGERTAEEKQLQKKHGVKPQTLVVLVSDGVAPVAMRGDRALDHFGGDLLDQVFLVSVTLFPAGGVAPGVDESAAGQLAVRAGGRSVVMRDVDAAAEAVRLGAELARPAPWRALSLDAGSAVLDDLELPGELAPGQGLVVVATWRGELPAKLRLEGRLAGEALDLEVKPVGGALAKAALPLWLAANGPEAFVPLSQRPEEADDDPASYKKETWQAALREYQAAARKVSAVTGWTSLAALAPGDAFAKDRAGFVKKWGATRFSRLPPPPERYPGQEPQPASPPTRREAPVLSSPRAFQPTGEIDEAIAKRLMQTYVVPQAKACYVKALRGDPDAEGDVDLIIEMARGEVTAVSIAASTFKSAEVDLCVIDAAFGIQVPRVGLGDERDAIVVVRYPLHFRLAAKGAQVTDEKLQPATQVPDPKKGGTPLDPNDPKAKQPQTP